MPPTGETRRNWRIEEIRELHWTPLLDLVFHAAAVHRAHHDAGRMQLCKLISIKTGACPEDCAYCSQSARYQTNVKPQGLMETRTAVETARRAKESGVSRVCLGAAWREAKDNAQFEQVLEMVRAITAEGVEVCCTLGMLTEAQARRLDEAGLYAYNHNLDTSEAFYPSIITTRKYEDRLRTLEHVRKTGVSVCCGGIIGLGESAEDRMAMLQTLANFDPHPSSVPINMLSRVEGTPLGEMAPVPVFETVRVIALARIMMPKAVVRLSAGRAEMSESDQALCFLAGANSIFTSEDGKMLTSAVPSPVYDADQRLMESLGLRPRGAFEEGHPDERRAACVE